MFYSLTGKVIKTDANSVAIECGGVGFLCFTSMNTLKHVAENGSVQTLYTYLNVREDALDLFGFYNERELECFKLLTGVTGVGPKAALAILSQFVPEKLALCVASGDIKSITQAQGVGPKLAQRVVLELKDKLGAGFQDMGVSGTYEAVGVVSASDNCSQAVSALEMLGYSRAEASGVVAKLDSALPVEELIRQALRNLA